MNEMRLSITLKFVFLESNAFWFALKIFISFITYYSFIFISTKYYNNFFKGYFNISFNKINQ